MAGTIPNLPLSTQFDKDTGRPLRGGRLHFFQAGTIATPQNAFRDTALTQPHPNPITLDGAGRIPSFYLADGAIHIRLANAQGVTQFEELNLLVVGPSSGGGGGGTPVDPSALFQTGDVIWLDQQGARAGWVRDNGRTIGSAVSGASERANADCQNLFAFLWTTYPALAVNGGRGSSAAVDWAANKWIALPDKRGYAPGGLDDMGNSPASAYAGVPFAAGNATTAGALCGAATHILTSAEIPPVPFSGTTGNDSPDHTHTVAAGYQGGISANSGGGGSYSAPSSTTSGASARHQHPFSGNISGGGGAHNITQRTVLGTFYRKL
jgi:hypothetical protein